MRLALLVLIPLLGSACVLMTSVASDGPLGKTVAFLASMFLLFSMSYIILGPSWSKIETGKMLLIVVALCVLSGGLAAFTALITSVILAGVFQSETTFFKSAMTYASTLSLWIMPAAPLLAAKIYIERPEWFELHD